MFIDTSAIVAILCLEEDAFALGRRIRLAPRRITSSVVRLETCMVLSSRMNVSPSEAQTTLDDFLAEADISVMGIDDAVARIAVEAFERFGKGRGMKAQLNLADCLSYACARAQGVPILFKGRDFSHTDLRVA